MALVQCENPCYQTCLNGSCTPCPAGTNQNCFYHDGKMYDITKLDCSECQQYAPQTQIGAASCMSNCQNPAGFSEEELDELDKNLKDRNRKIIVVTIIIVVLILLLALLFL